MDLNILIRSAVDVRNGCDCAPVQASSWIPRPKELEETRAKARGLLRALESA